MSDFLKALKKLDKSFEYDLDDCYVSKNYELAWIEDDKYGVHEIKYNSDTGLYDYWNLGVMTENQILKFIKQS